jgi:hypothetical protein
VLCLYPPVTHIRHGFTRYQNASAAESRGIQPAFYLPDQLGPLTRITDSEVCKTDDSTRTGHHGSHFPVTLAKTPALPFILLQKPHRVPRQRSPPPPPHQPSSALPDATRRPPQPESARLRPANDQRDALVQLRAHMAWYPTHPPGRLGMCLASDGNAT